MSKLGKRLMVLGALMLLACACLAAYNASLEAGAEQQITGTADALLDSIQQATAPHLRGSEPVEEGCKINGIEYLGVLSIPDLGRVLPIACSCSEATLKLAPCAYSGTVQDGAFVLAGHNYRAHFGGIETLPVGSQMLFTTANGATFCFEVAKTEILTASNVAGMTQTDWALSLFTCTYDGQQRITVRCNAVPQAK